MYERFKNDIIQERSKGNEGRLCFYCGDKKEKVDSRETPRDNTNLQEKI